MPTPNPITPQQIALKQALDDAYANLNTCAMALVDALDLTPDEITDAAEMVMEDQRDGPPSLHAVVDQAYLTRQCEEEADADA